MKEGTVVLPEGKDKEQSSENTYPTGQFGFLNRASGSVTLRLFDDGEFVLDVLPITHEDGRVEQGFIELDTFVTEIGDFLASRIWGRANWVLDDLGAEIKGEEYNLTALEWQTVDILRLLPDLKDNVYNAVEVGYPNREGDMIRLSALLDHIMHGNMKIQMKKDWVDDWIKGPLDQYVGYGAESIESEVIRQMNEWINDEENAMNPRVSMNISLDMTGMDKQDRGMLGAVTSDKAINLKAAMNLDSNKINGLHSESIINVEGFNLSKIYQPMKSGGNIKIGLLDIGNTKIAVAKKKTIQLTNIKATDLNMTLNKRRVNKTG